MRNLSIFTIFSYFVSWVPAACTPFDEGNLPSNYTTSAFPLPVPTLQLDFRMVIEISARWPVGPGPFGQRNWVAISGGSWAATWGNGTIVAGGQDSQIVIDDLSTLTDTAILLRTDDDTPAYISVKTSGWRTGPREVLERLANPATADSVKPTEYSFRLDVLLETGDSRYNEIVNTAMWVGSAAKLGNAVVYDGYQVG